MKTLLISLFLFSGCASLEKEPPAVMQGCGTGDCVFLQNIKGQYYCSCEGTSKFCRFECCEEAAK